MTEILTFISLFINIAVTISLKKYYTALLDQNYKTSQIQQSNSPNLPPNLMFFLKEVKVNVSVHFSSNKTRKKRPGRPRMNRMPLFMSALWYQLFHRGKIVDAVNEINKDPILSEFLGLQMNSLKLTSFKRFMKEELTGYLKVFIPENVHELIHQGIIPGKILAVDDYPVESFLNKSKAIDFPLPKKTLIESIFSQLKSLDWIDEFFSNPPNQQRDWSDYVRLYLFYQLTGFISNKTFNNFIKSHPKLKAWLKLKKKAVSIDTTLKYIQLIKKHSKQKEFFKKLLTQVLSIQEIRKKIKKNQEIIEIEQLFGILGNSYSSKDYGAKLHYNSSKGKYYFGRLGRIIVDTTTQIPLWIDIVPSHQALAVEIKRFGNEVTTILDNLIRPLTILFDKGFDGYLRMKALREGFTTALAIHITPPYNRYNQTKNIFRVERLAVERTIGHMDVRFNIEKPPLLGGEAALAWNLLAVYISQRIAIFNNKCHSDLSLTSIKYLQKRY